MKKRQKMGYKKSKRLFRKTSGSNVKNASRPPMRGGYRL
jgi:hypothetical protein